MKESGAARWWWDEHGHGRWRALELGNRRRPIFCTRLIRVSLSSRSGDSSFFLHNLTSMNVIVLQTGGIIYLE